MTNPHALPGSAASPGGPASEPAGASPGIAAASRRDNFDLLRAFGALLVLVSHSFALTGRPEPAVHGADTYGGLGVAIFFSISGYLIAQSWQRDPRLFAFLAKRGLRIFPALAVVVLLAAFALGPAVTTLSATDYFASPGTWKYLANIGLYIVYPLPGVFANLPHPGAVNGSLWTLPLEFFMYLTVAALGLLLRGSRWAYAATFATFALVAALWPAGRLQPIPLLGMDLRFIPFFGTYYFAGASICAFRLERHLTAPLLALLAIGLLATMWQPRWFTIVLWFALPAFVIALGHARSRGGAWLSRHGDFSYGLYIYAFPVQQTLLTFWASPPLVPYVAVAFVVTLACAVASWHLVEKPMLALKPGRRVIGQDGARFSR